MKMSVVKSKKHIYIAALTMVLLVIFDQITKLLAVQELRGKDPFVIIPGVFELRYLENRSAAFGVDLFSIIQNIFHFAYFENNPDAFLHCKMVLFAIFTIIVVILMILLYLKVPSDKNMKLRYLDWILVVFCAGAIGNCIDRIFQNFVTDFFYFSLINFPIFNVADIYVTVAAFFLIILCFFYYKEDDYEMIFPSKKERKNTK